jgi:hypothetical protein
MTKATLALALTAVALTIAVPFAASAQTVKITPLGSHEGEFCSRDRALSSRIRTGPACCMTPGTRCVAPRIRVWARSTRCC